MAWWRHARAVVLLPGMAAIGVPLVILLVGDGPESAWGADGALRVLIVAAAAALVIVGLGLWLWTVRLLAAVGRGTLAPWDPTTTLVAEGPYRHVRNPMITAVLAVLAGEALLLGSPGIAIWTAVFFVTNDVFFRVYEEPALEKRFGEPYREYCRKVPRWLPR